jgi:hypothetical protein
MASGSDHEAGRSRPGGLLGEDRAVADVLGALTLSQAGLASKAMLERDRRHADTGRRRPGACGSERRQRSRERLEPGAGSRLDARAGAYVVTVRSPWAAVPMRPRYAEHRPAHWSRWREQLPGAAGRPPRSSSASEQRDLLERAIHGAVRYLPHEAVPHLDDEGDRLCQPRRLQTIVRDTRAVTRGKNRRGASRVRPVPIRRALGADPHTN